MKMVETKKNGVELRFSAIERGRSGYAGGGCNPARHVCKKFFPI
jgi:hypothetical protein